MNNTTFAILITIGFSVVGVVGDYFLKLAADEPRSLRTLWFYIGLFVYGSTAFGWVFAMKHLKLATISAIYSVSMILMLAVVGVVGFRQSLSYLEMAGLAMAIGALVLLVRFTNL